MKGTHVLVAEDYGLQALDIADSLEEAGAHVVGPARHLDEAIHMARSSHCRAAVIDLRLGNRMAIPLGQELFQRKIPFIIHSGFDCREMLPMNWRCCRIMPKPVNIPDLIRSVALLIAGERARSRRLH